MPHSPALVLVDARSARRAAIRRGLPSAVVGLLIGGASLLPTLLPLLGH